ncbi:MAG: efflux RND transporter periplasmic adaptor subunit [Bacteroidales bacterium]|nr:efflux RND transporter periplasmic adaptor subunit [Bacteroidales bacterium]
MKALHLIRNKYIKSSLLVFAGLLLGWLIFSRSGGPAEKRPQEVTRERQEELTIWTCAMHPQIRMNKPGRCPICGMDLIVLREPGAESDDQAVVMSESAVKLAEVQTSIVTAGKSSKEVLLYGKIKPDERLLQSETAHVPGRIEKLFVNVTGETVRKGQLLAQVYSPELVTAQKELLEAVTLGDKYPDVPEAAREKLRNWKLSDQQISDIEASGKVSASFSIYANTSGVIINRRVDQGDYVSRGDVLFDVADLSHVWAVFEAYESDLPWIAVGQKISFTSRAIPGKNYVGRISFVDPVIDPVTRTASVRVELANPSLRLKPELFVNGTVMTDPEKNSRQLIIPHSSVLWTGTRSIVYVKIPGTEHPTFRMREITLGASLKDSYVVQEGLKDGEEIVTNGAFSVDAAAQLAGKHSMMNPEETGVAAGHNHADMNVESSSKSDQVRHSTTEMKVMDRSAVRNMNANIERIEFSVAGNCEMCKDRIESAARSVTGVSDAEWDIEKRQIHISFDKKKTDVAAIHKTIAAAGHDTDKETAPQKVYDSLPECCQYRNR